MKTLVVVGGLVLWLLLPVRLAAQGRGRTSRAELGLPPIAPIPPLGSFAPTPRGNRASGRPPRSGANSAWAYPYFGWDTGLDYASAGVPGVVILMSPPVVQAPAPPPEPPRPEIHEYHQAEPGLGPAATFSIVMKDGVIRSAVAVWVQGDSVNFITPESARVQTPLTSVDREATRRANAEKHLMLSLPEERVVQAS